MKTNYMFMAFAKGKESVEAAPVKRYIGVAPVTVLAVNPTKAELEKIYGITLENTPEYLSTVEVNGKKVKQVRLDFIVKTVAEKCNEIDFISKVSFFINDSVRYSKDNTKIQVINKYGETTWLSIEDAKAKRVPDNLSWFEPADFRPAYIGEEELTGFIKAYLNIPNKSYRDANGNVVELKDKSEAEARLDKISNYFNGDTSELKEVVALQPNNKVRVLFGVRTTDDGKQYQAVYTQKFLKYGNTNYASLEKEVNDRKANGAYPTTEFKVCDLQEYTVEATDLSKPVENDVDDLPFGNSNDPWGN